MMSQLTVHERQVNATYLILTLPLILVCCASGLDEPSIYAVLSALNQRYRSQLCLPAAVPTHQIANGRGTTGWSVHGFQVFGLPNDEKINIIELMVHERQVNATYFILPLLISSPFCHLRQQFSLYII
jgi:hypothetical protein